MLKKMPGRLICFVCGNPGAETGIFVRQQERGPYFPFLEHHDPPKGSRLPTPEGSVDCCRVCYAFLTSQWETYERTKTPAIKRLYWLKRADNGAFTGAEMRLQGEYIAQVMGLQYQPGGFEDGGSPEGSNFMPESEYTSRTTHQSEIRVPQYSYNNSKPVEKQHSAYVSNTSTPRSKNVSLDSALDLSTSKKELERRRNPQEAENQSKNRKFVCYVCGQLHSVENGKHINVLKPLVSEPYFPVLEKIPPSPGAEFMNRNGQVRVCSGCKNVFYQQWQAYEMSATPINLRTYKIPDELLAHAEKEKNRQAVKQEDKKENTKGSFVCYICGVSNVVDHALSLNTLPDKSPSPPSMFFPFVRDLKRPSGAKPLRSDGSVFACIKCYGHLSYQWSVQEMEGVPVYHRQYSLSFLSQSASDPPTGSSRPRPKTPTSSEVIQPLNIQISASSPVPSIQHSDSTTFQTTQGLLAIAPHIESSSGPQLQKRLPYSPPPTVSQISHTVKDTPPASTESNTGKSKTVPHPLQQVSLIPKKTCFICGEKCLINKMHNLLSYPARHEAKLANVQVEPFFPFLANKDPAPGADPMTEDGTVTACKLCFYSLLKQWIEFEKSKNPSASNRWLRKYQLPDYVCFVCGTNCERKYVRSLSTRKFPFLKEHRTGPNSLVMDEGEKVAVCKACAYCLMQQFSEYERMGVPEEQRKYNWSQKSALMYDSTEDGESLDESRFEKYKLDSSLEEKGSNQDTGYQTSDAKSGSAHGSKPAPLNMISPAGSKLQRNTATVSPVHHVSSPTNGVTSIGANSALNASRTSSFAAALRKLANQAKDPPDETSVKPSTSSSPRETPSKRGPPPLVYSSSTTLTSPPVVTIAPTQSHSGIHSSDARHNMERERVHLPSHSSSSLFEPVVKSDRDRPHSSLSRDDDRSSSRDNHSQSNRRLTPHSTPGTGSPMSSREESSARGFQPYRPGDEMRHPLPTSLPVDPAAAAAAAYSYPAFLPPHAFPHPAFRFDDPLLLERYRMMHPPYMPYSSAGIMPHPALHPLLAGGRYPPELLPPQLAFASQGSRLTDHRSPSVLSERHRLEEEKQRDIEREKEREKERELARQRAIERENERQRERTLSREREQERRESSEKSRAEHPVREKMEESLSARFGSIIQGTPKGLGIADRYPRVPSISSHSSSGQRDEHRSSKDEAASYHSSSSFSRDTQKIMDDQKFLDHEKRYSLMNAGNDLDRPRPPPLVSPKSRDDNHSRVHKSSSEGGLFRPFDSKHLSNGVENSFSLDSSKLFQHQRDVGDQARYNSDYPAQERKNKSSYGKDKEVSRLTQFSSSSSAFHSLDNRVPSSHSSQLFPKVSQNHHQNSNKNHSIPPQQQSTELHPLTTHNNNSSNPPPLNVPSYSSSVLSTAKIQESPTSVVSKLDLEEKRICESRTNDSYCSDSECEMDSFEETRERNLLITSGPPIALDTPPKKMKLFKQLGLTTHKIKKDRQYNQLRRRRRRMRERSLSPVELEDEQTGLSTPNTKIKPEMLCREPDYRDKCNFFAAQFRLEPVGPDRRKVFEQINSVCEAERRRRLVNGTDNDHFEQSSREGTGVKRKLDEVEEGDERHSVSHKAPSLVNSHSHTGIAHAIPDLITQAQGQARKSHKVKPHNNSAILYPAKHQHQKLGKDFVQEFHNSVLQSTRQKELAQKLGQASAIGAEDSSRRLSDEVSKSSEHVSRHLTSDQHHSGHTSKDRGHHHGSQPSASASASTSRDKPGPHNQTSHSSRTGMSPWGLMGPYNYNMGLGLGMLWPGVSGVMESYHQHVRDEALERYILMERTRRLQKDNSDLNRTAEQLSQRMEDLLKVKKQQDEDRQKTQARIDGLKTLMKKIR